MGVFGTIFRRALRDTRGSILGWGLGFAILSMYMVIMFPYIEDLLEPFEAMLESPVIGALVGDVDSFATFEGFLSIKLFTALPLLFGIYGILFGLGIVANEEQKGTLDVLLSTPTRRWQVIAAKFGAFVIAVVCIALFMAVGLYGGSLMLENSSLSLSMVLQATISILPMSLFIASGTLLLSVVVRSRNVAAGIASAILIVGYFTSTIGPSLEPPMDNIRYLSFYEYYNGSTVLVDGIYWAGFLGLFIVALGMTALAMVLFERRDLYA